MPDAEDTIQLTNHKFGKCTIPKASSKINSPWDTTSRLSYPRTSTTDMASTMSSFVMTDQARLALSALAKPTD